jgi:GAF domain-containing protein
MSEKPVRKEAGFPSRLGHLLDVLEASGQAVFPFSGDELLQSIVEAAARIFHAGAASIMLVDEHHKELVFRVTTGSSSKDLVGMRFPLGQGIAGYVVLTGQPLAISNVRQDARFNQDFAKSTGYVPTSILAMPLKSGERIIGVMEVLDKIDSTSFGMQDLELLGIFARQAAIAIAQSEHVNQVKGAILKAIKRLAKKEAIPAEELQAFLKDATAAGDRKELLEMAGIINEISLLGEEDRQLCLQVLKVFSEHRKSLRKKMYHVR